MLCRTETLLLSLIDANWTAHQNIIILCNKHTTALTIEKSVKNYERMLCIILILMQYLQ